MTLIKDEVLKTVRGADLPPPLREWMKGVVTVVPKRTPSVAVCVRDKKCTAVKPVVLSMLRSEAGPIWSLQAVPYILEFTRPTVEIQHSLHPVIDSIPCPCAKLKTAYPTLFAGDRDHVVIRTPQHWSAILIADTLPLVPHNARNATLPSA